MELNCLVKITAIVDFKKLKTQSFYISEIKQIGLEKNGFVFIQTEKITFFLNTKNIESVVLQVNTIITSYLRKFGYLPEIINE